MNLLSKRKIIHLMLIAGFAMNLSAQNAQIERVTQILESYAEDYTSDVMLKKDVHFGVKVGDDFWSVHAVAKKESSEAKVTVTQGTPKTPTFYFVTDFETLKKIDAGELNALTGSAKAFSSDFAPFDMDVMSGFTPDQNFISTALNVLFHFWTKGKPEVIPFGLDKTRMTHGAQATIFYYQPGFRSAYVAIKKGQHANKDEKSQSNPFPTLFIAIKGSATIIIDGEESTLNEGNAILIPPGVKHEFINPNDDLFEGILLMFGKGA